ncbi:MAG: succinylglutamate-semialdehyde dehydrogenase [Phycisphaeraceae bacterium]|nr:succinylglutamate-semialdehyde dehydrogenase [Phycisphaeraceae bacterium]
MPADQFIDGAWVEGGGGALQALNPSTGDVAWSGSTASDAQAAAAMDAARRAQTAWARRTVDDRTGLLKRFEAALKARRDALIDAISAEVGKPRWESATEVGAMTGKIDASIRAYTERCAETAIKVGDAAGATRFRPHGVVVVLGPFNFPGHIPNGHIVPALLAGNTVVFKPSERTPATAHVTLEAWEAAGLPGGVINLVHGARDTASALLDHDELDGVYFTGGSAAGLALMRRFSERPDRILALELGGNNPLVVHEAGNLDAAAVLTIQSGFLTAGQRCTCARRLIVPAGRAGDAFLDRLAELTRTVRVGPPEMTPEPFMGPVINDDVGASLLEAQKALGDRGARPLVEMKANGSRPAMLHPGLIDVTDVADREDEELFGPLLQVIRVADFEAAIAEANRTRYGLVAGLLSDHRGLYERFYDAGRAGLINWNRPTTGASGLLPFGGIGFSGNHRPAGYFAADYCSYPVASIECERVEMPSLPPGLASDTSPK